MKYPLTVNIVKDEQIIASVTYSGSGSMHDTFDRLCELRNIFIKTRSTEIDELQLALIRGLEEKGGGLNPEKVNVSRAVSEFKQENYTTNPDPAKGLVAIAPLTIRDANVTGEGNPEPSVIDLDTNSATNHSYFIVEGHGNSEEYPEVTGFDEGADLWDIPFRKLEKMQKVTDDLPEKFEAVSGHRVVKA